MMLCETQTEKVGLVGSDYLARVSKLAANPAAAKQSRRSVRSLSVQEKVLAIDRVHEGESKASVARDIGVPESTLRGWCKGEEKLRGIVARSGGNSAENAGSSNDESFDKPDIVKAHKRDYSLMDETLYQSSVVKKYASLDKSTNEVPPEDSNQRNCESPLNFSKTNEHLNGTKSRHSYSPSREDVREGKGEEKHLPGLAAIASAISNKNQMLYSAYANGLLGHESGSKPLDYSTKLATGLPRSDMNEALLYWLQSQREQAALPISPMEARTADTSGWFWKWYKNYGVLPQVPTTSHPIRAANGSDDNGQLTDEEDEPPATAADAVRHGEKFLRWLECCSDPSVTALQILQFRYLLNNVKECAERRAKQVRTKTRSRRK